jgi:hypothetical protein
MSDTVFRTSIEPQKTTTPITGKGDGSTTLQTEVEPPFTSYEGDKGKPFLVDHYELGRYWSESGQFEGEVSTINTYINHLINTGEIGDNLNAVKNTLKGIEKMINLKADSRTSSRIGQVAAYCEFLIKADHIKKESAKYGLI